MVAFILSTGSHIINSSTSLARTSTVELRIMLALGTEFLNLSARSVKKDMSLNFVRVSKFGLHNSILILQFLSP